MANLRNFVWSGLRAGMDVDVYPASKWPKVGSGKVEILEPLHLKFTGEGFGQKGTIEIIMPNDGTIGVCTVILNGERSNNCQYAVNGQTLYINHPKTQIRIQANDSKWTWVYSSAPVGVWGGIWPTGMTLEIEDTISPLQ